MPIKHLTPLVAAVLSLLLVALPAVAATGETLANARDATAIFTDPSAALAGGYELLTDADGIACIDMAGMGAMGIHYVKGALVQGGKLDPARPQALVYDVQANGRIRLAALEYVLIQSAWDATHPSPPTLFGEKFQLTPAGNRFGLPAFYSLHVWLWKDNPAGMFSPWNPRVRCATRVQTEARDNVLDHMHASGGRGVESE